MKKTLLLITLVAAGINAHGESYLSECYHARTVFKTPENTYTINGRNPSYYTKRFLASGAICLLSAGVHAMHGKRINAKIKNKTLSLGEAAIFLAEKVVILRSVFYCAVSAFPIYIAGDHVRRKRKTCDLTKTETYTFSNDCFPVAE
jgi:hypothetical protein